MNKQKLFCIISVLALVFTIVAACRTVDEPPPPIPTPEPVPDYFDDSVSTDTITLQWAVWDIDMLRYYEPLIEAYKDIAPDISIELVNLNIDTWNNDVLTHLIGGHDYDIIKILDAQGYLMHVNTDMLLALNDKATDRGINIGDYKGIPEQFMVDGSFYALPFICDFWVVYYNKDVFNELDEDEEELDAVEEAQFEEDAKVSRPTNEMTFDMWSEIIINATHGSGEDKIWGNFFHYSRSATTLFGVLDGRNTIYDGNYDFLIPYYEAVLALEDGRYVPRRTDVLAEPLHYRDLWLSGHLAQLNMGTWFIADAVNSGFNWGLAAYPVPTSNNYGNTFGRVTQLAIPKSANHPVEAMDFITFVTGEQGAQILASNGYIPVNMTDTAIEALIEIPGFPKDDITMGALRPSIIFLEQPLNEYIDDINTILDEVHNNIMDRVITIDDGIAMMNERVGAITGN